MPKTIASSKGWAGLQVACVYEVDDHRRTDKHLLLNSWTAHRRATCLVCVGALPTNTLQRLLCYTPRASDWQHRSPSRGLPSAPTLARVQKLPPMRGGCTAEEMDGGQKLYQIYSSHEVISRGWALLLQPAPSSLSSLLCQSLHSRPGE